MNRSAFKDLFLIATLIFLVNVVLMLFGSLYISKSISNPIYALIGMMNTVKDRNFRKIPVKYPKSEIGIYRRITITWWTRYHPAVQAGGGAENQGKGGAARVV